MASPARDASPTRLAVSTALACAGIAALAPAGAAALTAVPPRSALEVPRIDGPSVAALPDGRVLVGWTNGDNNGDTTLALVRPAGGVLPAEPQVLRSGVASSQLALLGGGPAGTPPLIHFVDGSDIPTVARLSGDEFVGQQPVSTSDTRRLTYARCASGASVLGLVTANSNGTFTASGRRASASGTPVGSPTTFNAGPDSNQQVAVSCDQEIPLVAAARDADGVGGNGQTLNVSTVGVNANLFSDTLAAGEFTDSAPTARVGPDGRLWVLTSTYTTSTSTVSIATRPPGFATGATSLSGTDLASDAQAGRRSLFFDAAGNTHVLIERENPVTDNESYFLRTAPAGTTAFGPEQELLPEADQSVTVLTDHPDGNPRLLVGRPGPAPDFNTIYELRGIPQAGSGGAVTPLGIEVGSGFLATTFLPTGELFAATGFEVATDRVQLREGGLDDGTPPTLSNVDVPALATPGVPVQLRIEARDSLGLSAFSWTVDGQTLTEQQASFTFNRPGTFVVTARAVDRLGGATELSRTVRVLDPAAVTPGSSEFTDAVIRAGGTLTPAAPPAAPPAPAPRDTTAPKLTKSSATRGRKGKSKSRASVQLTASETASADLELVGTLRRGADRGRLVLRSARIAQLTAGRAQTRTLTIPASLARLVGNRLQVRVTLTDLAGNRTTKTITVRTAKR